MSQPPEASPAHAATAMSDYSDIDNGTPRSGTSRSSHRSDMTTQMYIDITALESLKADIKLLRRLAEVHHEEARRQQLRHELLLVATILISVCTGGVAVAQESGGCVGCETVMLVLVALQSFCSVLMSQLKFQARSVYHHNAAKAVSGFMRSLQSQIVTSDMPAAMYERTRDSVHRIMEAHPWPTSSQFQDSELDTGFMEQLDARKFVLSKHQMQKAKSDATADTVRTDGRLATIAEV